MDKNEILSYEMMVRVRDFSTTRVADFPPSSQAGRYFAEWTAIVTEFAHQAEVQARSVSEVLVNGATKARLGASLREDMRILVGTARVITADNPNLTKKFRVPKGGDQRFLAGARAFLKDVAPFADRFPEHEIPADALEKFGRDVSSFETAITERNQNRGLRIQATSRLAMLRAKAFKLLQKLDVIVRNKYRNDTPNLSAWEMARHVERRNARPRKGRKADQSKAKPPTGQTTSGVSATG